MKAGAFHDMIYNQKIKIFPIDRCRQEVRRLAVGLDCRQGEQANIFWRTEMRAIALRLAASGDEEQSIAAQIKRLGVAVQLDLVAMCDELEEQARAK